MFEQALLESARHLPGTQRTCSTAASLLLQAAALATFVIVQYSVLTSYRDFTITHRFLCRNSLLLRSLNPLEREV